MLLMILGLAGLGSVLLAQGLTPDPAQRAIRTRLAVELHAGEEAPVRRGGLARLLKKISDWSPLKSKGFQKTLGRSLETGHVHLTALEFIALKQMTALAAVACAISLLSAGQRSLLSIAVAALLGFCLPDVWLRQRIGARHLAISRDLPDMVDLLSLSVGAGADFMAAATRATREFRKGPLAEELSMMLQEIRFGKRRRDAIRAMALRVDSADVSSFARTLIQADRMGTGIAEALLIQSEDSRMRRHELTERLAQQAPLKMLIPLIFCIMPSVLIVVAGPVLLQFMQGDLLGKLKF